MNVPKALKVYFDDVQVQEGAPPIHVSTAATVGSHRSIVVQDVTDSTLLRFLRVRAMNVPKASKLYLEDVKWRKEYLPVRMEDVEAELRSGKALVASKPGERPWVYMFAKNHDMNTRDMDTFRSESHILG